MQTIAAKNCKEKIVKYLILILVLFSTAAFARDDGNPRIPEQPAPSPAPAPSPSPTASDDEDRSERRWCRRSDLRTLACVGAAVLGGYVIYSYDAPKDEKVKFGVGAKP